MVEIRTYDGNGNDVVELTSRTWRAAYGGKFWCPYWDTDYIRWQLLADRPGGRDFLVAAYEGTRLVGCFFAERMPFRIRDCQVTGTIGSWFTVDIEGRSPRLGLELVEELRRRHREHGAAFMVGYVNGHAETPAYKFWAGYGKLYPEHVRFVRKIGYWIRVLNPSSVGRKCVHRAERLGVRILGLPIFGQPRRPPRGVRQMSSGDLSACHGLVETASAYGDLANIWTQDRLAHQLSGNGFPRTLVADGDGDASGFVNFHRMGLLGADVISTGLIDLLAAAGNSQRIKRKLVRSAVSRMRSEGLELALALRMRMFPPRVMLLCGFIPVPQTDYLVYAFAEKGLALPSADRPCVLFR